MIVTPSSYTFTFRQTRATSHALMEAPGSSSEFTLERHEPLQGHLFLISGGRKAHLANLRRKIQLLGGRVVNNCSHQLTAHIVPYNFSPSEYKLGQAQLFNKPTVNEHFVDACSTAGKLVDWRPFALSSSSPPKNVIDLDAISDANNHPIRQTPSTSYDPMPSSPTMPPTSSPSSSSISSHTSHPHIRLRVLPMPSSSTSLAAAPSRITLSQDPAPAIATTSATPGELTTTTTFPPPRLYAFHHYKPKPPVSDALCKSRASAPAFRHAIPSLSPTLVRRNNLSHDDEEAVVILTQLYRYQ